MYSMLDINEFTKKNYEIFNNNEFEIKENNIIYNFFNDIKNAFNSFNNENYKYVIYEISKKNIIDLKHENHFPINAKIKIKELLNYVYNVELIIDNRVTNIFLFTEDVNSINKKYIMIIIVWLNIVNKYSSKKCTKKLNIYLYLIDYKKILPNSNHDIGTDHINSGFSYAGCMNQNEITVFRKEEWFKVLIHETIHAFNLHFDLKSNDYINIMLNNFYNLNIDYCAFEAYCECWALLWNSMFHAYIKTKSYESFLIKLKMIYSMECKFTNNQCKKLSNHIGLNDEFYKENYKENTPVFSYFFLKRNLLLNIDEFLNFCENNNKSMLNFDTNRENIDLFLNIIKKKDNTNIIILNNDNNSRMTLFEFE